MAKRSGIKVMLSLISLIKPLIGLMFLAVLMGVIGNLSATFISVLGSFLIVNVLGYPTFFNFNLLISLLLICALARGILRYCEQYCNHFIAFKLLALIRHQVFKALRKLAFAKLEVKDKGDLLALITSDIELLEVFYAHTISPILIAFIFSLVMLIFIGYYHWLLAIWALFAYVIVGILVPLLMSKFSKDLGLKIRNLAGNLSSYVLDNLRGISEVLQYHQNKNRLSGMDQKTVELLEHEERMKVVIGVNQGLIQGLIWFFDLGMLVISAHLYWFGLIGFNVVIIVTIALMSSFGPVVALANLGTTLQNTLAAGNRVLDILEEKPVIEEVTIGQQVDFTGVTIKNVNFAYDQELILRDINLEIKPQTILGLIGSSGSGKSTLLRLLMRYYDVNQGEIIYGETNIKNIQTTNLRNMISFMTQETHLFNDSIKNNLLIAKLDANDQQLIGVCKQVAIHDFIMSLPNGYDTLIGELGDKLSGGQRQRLGLARALLHNSDLLLLDEPTSNLDSLNEALILKSLVETRENKTIILVSHRKSTLRIVDDLYYIDNGRLS